MQEIKENLILEHIKKHFSLFASFFIEIPKMSRLCLLIITHWQDIYNQIMLFSQAIQHTAITGLHNHFLALWIYKKQQSDKNVHAWEIPRGAFSCLFCSQGTFCKAQGTRQLYDDSAYSSLTTQTHTHTQTLSYITAGKRGVSFIQVAFIFSSI